MDQNRLTTNRLLLGSLAIAALVALPTASLAIQPELANPGANLMVAAPALEVAPSLEIYELGASRAADIPALQRFFNAHSNLWEVRWDSRGDRPNLLQGAGVPVIPGAGNSLTRADLGLADGKIRIEDVERQLRGFMSSFPELFRVAQSDLVLDRNASVVMGLGDYFWNVEFQQFVNGVPVDGAKVYFRINHGNVVQFGNELIGDVRISTLPGVSRENALAVALEHLKVRAGQVSELLNPGTLKVFPALTPGEVPAQTFAGQAGAGYDHLLAWEFSFRRAGDVRTYRARIDAQNGKLLELIDTNAYETDAAAVVDGGIYPVTNSDAEVVKGMPFANLTNGGAKTTDTNGNYDYSGGTATVTLNGKYTRIADNCGAISLSNNTDGNLHLGTSAGTNCTTPGVGGAGNTHSARSGFYHLTLANRQAAGFLPGNGWLGGNLTANMNINNTCNAFWNGSSVNFYRSGGGCSNTGEIAGVFVHEWGHGLDSNTGGAANDAASGEAVGDMCAALYLQDGCIGDNFTPGNPCANCRASCTGVRDLVAFASGGISTIASPANVTANGGINCDRWACPFTGYEGPMGYEGHCESYIASTAVWDLAQKIGFPATRTIWFNSLQSSKNMYRVVSGGKCNVNATVDGCGANNWYTVFIAVDDDNGDLSDGTPHGCDIWDAFHAHGISCGDSGPACSECTPDEPDKEITCDDGKDNDCDGLIDDQDPDCGGGCNIAVGIRNKQVHPGEALQWGLSLTHNRLDTVVASFRMWVEDAQGNIVARRDSVEHIFHYLDTVSVQGEIPIPQTQAPGEYKLVVAIGEMLQGVARAEKAFTVVQ